MGYVTTCTKNPGLGFVGHQHFGLPLL